MLADVAQIRRRVRMRRRVQAAMKGLASILQWAGLLYAIPGMLLLGLLLVGMALPAVFILAALVLLQLPFYLAWRVLGSDDDCLELEQKRAT
jgi:hypothetical protein